MREKKRYLKNERELDLLHRLDMYRVNREDLLNIGDSWSSLVVERLDMIYEIL